MWFLRSHVRNISAYCGPWTNSINIVWRFVRNAQFLSPTPDLPNQSLHFTKSQGYLYIYWSLRSSVIKTYTLNVYVSIDFICIYALLKLPFRYIPVTTISLEAHSECSSCVPLIFREGLILLNCRTLEQEWFLPSILCAYTWH